MSHTPAMQQYYDMKKEYEDSILFFRMGDFYEMFDDDAVVAHKILGVAITSRNKNSLKPTPLAGIPFHAKDKYLGLLVDAGYKVAIAEQTGDLNEKGVMQREVVRVVTPATLTFESDNYEANTSQIMISVYFEENFYWISIFNLSKFEIQIGKFSNSQNIISILSPFSPKEIIFNSENTKKYGDLFEKISKKTEFVTYTHELPKKSEEYLKNHFGVQSMQAFGIKKDLSAINSLALGLNYLEKNQKQNLKFLQNIKILSSGKYLSLDASTIRSLDIVFNSVLGTSKEGTLLSVLDNTFSTLGKRKMYYEILHPLRSINIITQRQGFIADLISDVVLFDKIQNELKKIYDTEAILGRIALGRSSLKDINNLKTSLISLQNIKKIIEESNLENIKNLIK